MRFADIYTDVEKVSGQTSASRATLKRGIQTWLYRYATLWPWPHYRDRGVVLTLDDYATGTVSVTNGSTAVTGSGTSWDTSWAGRKIRIGSDNAWYRIASVASATSLTLQDAYQGTTSSSSTYTIYQDEYRLDPDTHLPLDMVQTENQILMRGFNYLSFDQLFSDPTSLGDSVYLSMIGRRQDTNTTGTVTGSAGGATLTGVGTSWTSLAGFGKGSRIAVTNNNEVYTVRSVDSATSLTTYELISTAFSASALTIYLNNLLVQVSPPPDAARNLYYRKHRLPSPLVNDRDEPDMPLEHHGILIEAGLITAYTLLGHLDRAKAIEQRLKEWLVEQIRELGQDSPQPDFTREPLESYLLGSPAGPRLPAGYGYPLYGWT